MRAKQYYLKGQLDDSISDANECIQLVQNDLNQRRISRRGLSQYRSLFLPLKGENARCFEMVSADALNIIRSINDKKNEAVINLETGLLTKT